jgi:sRNA-binding protein
MGRTEDLRARIYRDVQGMTLQDVINFHDQFVKGRTYYYCILGDAARLDLDAVNQLGPVTTVTPEQIFVY